jgi:hypothetical protein
MVRQAALGLAIAIAIVSGVLLPQRGGAAETPATDQRTQIVVQWPIDATTDISLHEVWALEDRLEAESEGLYDVDGDDFGTGAANVFLYADDPEAAVRKVVSIYQMGQLRPGMRIGVREYREDTKRWDYRPVFPRGLHRFDLIY